MKNIVCYGDSNTFGFNPECGLRYEENVRWTSILQNNLGNSYKVINEGMCDRTGFVDNPNGIVYSAQKHFPEYINKSEAMDILVLWLGTNDAQSRYEVNAVTIEKGLINLIEIGKTKAKKIIVISPIRLSMKVLEGNFKTKFDKTSIEKSAIIEKICSVTTPKYNCKYLDVNKLVETSVIDGLHLTEKSHKIIADKLLQLF